MASGCLPRRPLVALGARRARAFPRGTRRALAPRAALPDEISGLKYVSPRAGDALIWANVDAEGEPNERSLHEGRPPKGGEKLAINVWVADRPFEVSSGGGQGLKRAVVT